MAIVTHAGAIQYRGGAKLLLHKLADCFDCLSLIWGDGGYADKFIHWVANSHHSVLQVAKPSDGLKGFAALFQ